MRERCNRVAVASTAVFIRSAARSDAVLSSNSEIATLALTAARFDGLLALDKTMRRHVR